jgi:hypothetical protein
MQYYEFSAWAAHLSHQKTSDNSYAQAVPGQLGMSS